LGTAGYASNGEWISLAEQVIGCVGEAGHYRYPVVIGATLLAMREDYCVRSLKLAGNDPWDMTNAVDHCLPDFFFSRSFSICSSYLFVDRPKTSRGFALIN